LSANKKNSPGFFSPAGAFWLNTPAEIWQSNCLAGVISLIGGLEVNSITCPGQALMQARLKIKPE
jgi:hypothetical protein